MAESLAERFRKAREAFEAGLEMGCSPRDAVTREIEQPALWYQQGDMA